MSARILIAGTGKTGHDIGRFLLKRGHAVTWLFRDGTHRARLEARLEKDLRRMARSGIDLSTDQAAVREYSAPELTPPQIFIESVSESIEAKQAVFKRVAHLLSNEVLLLSNSSSLLPSEIHPRCIGMHCFYPLELSGSVELVLPAACHPDMEARATELATTSGLTVIRQDSHNAFAVNRLLLALQAECLRALASGLAAEAVNEASASDLLPIGQLQLIDSIGLDTVGASVANYLRRMPTDSAADYRELDEGLRLLDGLGKQGKKNGNGFLLGTPLPWNSMQPDPGDLHQRLLYLFINSCYCFVETGAISRTDLDEALKAILGSQRQLDDVVADETRSRICAVLEPCAAETGRGYFVPAATLRP